MYGQTKNDASKEQFAEQLFKAGWRSSDKQELLESSGFTIDEVNKICATLSTLESPEKKAILTEALETKEEIFHNDNGTDYIIVERSKTGTNALLKHPSGKKWIIAWNCPKNNKGSWGQGHYFFNEKEAREIWEDKYLNESINEDLQENDYSDFKAAIYNALTDVVFFYQNQQNLPVSKADIEKAIEWFEVHFFDDEFEESLKECLRKLNEAEMSDEDRKDSER